MADVWSREPALSLSSEEPLRIKVTACGRIGYARVWGPLDVATIVPLKNHILNVLNHGCRALILDLSGVQFVDSEGVRALLQLRDEAEKRRARLRVVVPVGSRVDRTLRLLRFDSLFPIFRSVTAAWKRRQHGRRGNGAQGRMEI
jgi:anti-anti-sigma factor